MGFTAKKSIVAILRKVAQMLGRPGGANRWGAPLACGSRRHSLFWGSSWGRADVARQLYEHTQDVGAQPRILFARQKNNKINHIRGARFPHPISL